MWGQCGSCHRRRALQPAAAKHLHMFGRLMSRKYTLMAKRSTKHWLICTKCHDFLDQAISFIRMWKGVRRPEKKLDRATLPSTEDLSVWITEEQYYDHVVSKETVAGAIEQGSAGSSDDEAEPLAVGKSPPSDALSHKEHILILSIAPGEALPGLPLSSMSQDPPSPVPVSWAEEQDTAGGGGGAGCGQEGGAPVELPPGLPEPVPLLPEEALEVARARRLSDNYMRAPYKCELCFRGFLDAGTLRRHARRHDAAAGAHPCAVCRLRYPSRARLRRHYAAAHEHKYRCTLCALTTYTRTAAMTHFKSHQGLRPHKCTHCNMTFRCPSTLLTHVRLKHVSAHVCRQCGNTFVSGRGLQRHARLMHEGRGATDAPAALPPAAACAPCRLAFYTRHAYVKHLLTAPKHTEEVRGAGKGGENAVGGEEGEGAGRLVGVGVGAGELAWACAQCGATPRSALELREHRRREHKRPGAAFAYAAGLVRARRDTAQAPAHAHTQAQEACACPRCGAALPAAAFPAHLRACLPPDQRPTPATYPTLRKRWVCEECGKAFRCRAVLATHQRRHRGERPYACAQPACAKAFHSKALLAQHSKFHSARVHACPLPSCARTFALKPQLQRHARTHSGHKPYACPLPACTRAFADDAARKVHLRQVHLYLPPTSTTTTTTTATSD